MKKHTIEERTEIQYPSDKIFATAGSNLPRTDFNFSFHIRFVFCYEVVDVMNFDCFPARFNIWKRNAGRSYFYYKPLFIVTSIFQIVSRKINWKRGSDF